MKTGILSFNQDRPFALINHPFNYLIVKRLIDIFLSMVLILITLPVLVVTILLLILTNQKRVFFKQKRIGFLGKPFDIYKFRTMKDFCGRNPEVNSLEKSDGVLFKTGNDPRISKIGKILRKTSIDELPQLINVIKGDMSIVGPRPLIPFMIDSYPELKKIRCMVKPGLTGLWQVKARGDNCSVLQMIDYDSEYINSLSLAQDLKIILLTIPKVILCVGAV